MPLRLPALLIPLVLTLTPAARAAPGPLPLQPPLSTKGRYIVGSDGQRVKLKGVNWYGASDGYNVVGGLDKNSVRNIVTVIKQLGFNIVRLPFSNAMLRATKVDPVSVSANPQLLALTPLQVYDDVVSELTAQGVMVLLNNHTTTPVWCCGWDENALWFSSTFTTENFISDWEMMAKRYSGNPLVVGADLRNEIRWGQAGGPKWGSNDQFDWHNVAQEAGDRLLTVSPNLLIVVEGLNYATDLTGAGGQPVVLKEPGHVVYSSHSYSWFNGTTKPVYEDLRDGLDRQWGYMVKNGTQTPEAPVLVGEFGAAPTDDPAWLGLFVRYLKERDMDWAIWPLNVGPKAGGAWESWGFVTPDWSAPLSDWRTDLLKTIE